MDELEKQITGEVSAITVFLEQQLGRRSRWNREVELSDDPASFGKALWNGRINIDRTLAKTDLRWRTQIHEALHLFSVGLNSSSYSQLRGWEEGVIEQLQRKLRASTLSTLNVSVPEDIFLAVENRHYYNSFISALEEIREALREPAEAFYLRLLATPLTERPAGVVELSRRLTTEETISFRRIFALSFSILRK